MPIGPDVQGTTYSDLRAAKDKSKVRRAMLKKAVKGEKKRKKGSRSTSTSDGY